MKKEKKQRRAVIKRWLIEIKNHSVLPEFIIKILFWMFHLKHA